MSWRNHRTTFKATAKKKLDKETIDFLVEKLTEVEEEVEQEALAALEEFEPDGWPLTTEHSPYKQAKLFRQDKVQEYRRRAELGLDLFVDRPPARGGSNGRQ